MTGRVQGGTTVDSEELRVGEVKEEAKCAPGKAAK